MKTIKQILLGGTLAAAVIAAAPSAWAQQINGTPVSPHGALFTDASGADYGPQPSLDGVRRDLGVVHGLPGLRFRHEPGEGQHWHDPPGQWLRHVMVRQEPQYAGIPAQLVRPLRSMAVGDGL